MYLGMGLGVDWRQLAIRRQIVTPGPPNQRTQTALFLLLVICKNICQLFSHFLYLNPLESCIVSVSLSFGGSSIVGLFLVRFMSQSIFSEPG